ncbi:elongation factor Ts, mitochondrial [Anoplophora glabripennis]|nr:elongation factor Ts, mitochondrial [Anoplophora glabripennis]
MIITRTVVKLFHTGAVNPATEKSLLATLRKKTGYTFTNCKKALEMHNNDLSQAEAWLNQQAQSLGWSKATKLEGRHTTQGLIGVSVNNDDGVLVEVNCETDFVARNKEFQKMVEETAKTCLDYVRNHQKSKDMITKICLDAEQLKNLKTNDGKSLADKLALMIGMVGENAVLKRAMCLKTGNGVHLSGYAHPSGITSDNVMIGRLGGLLAYRPLEPSEAVNSVSKGICQHIVGMHPKKIGSSDDEPAKNKDEETCLIHQEYLLADELTVKEVLEENKIEIVDFKRFECGESDRALGDQPLEFVETCQ